MLLEIKEVSKHFGGLKVLDKVGFTVSSGNGIVGLIGPNGAGKTTMINLITGYFQPDSGDILIDGKSITGFNTYDLPRMGIVRTFQTPRICKSMTVLENTLIGRHVLFRANFLQVIFQTKISRYDEIKARVKCMDALHDVGLEAFANRSAGILTSGQQRLLNLATVISCDPGLILLDEPCAGLSDTEIDLACETVKNIHKGGCAILLIEHNIDMVKKVCSRIAVLDFGVKIAEGPPNEVMDNPAVHKAYFGEEAC